ncbi:MAG: rRNA maturation RNase YbeY [Thermoanaerobaculia bacterium]
MKVDVRSTLRRPGYPAGKAKKFLNRALGLSGQSASEISVLFCGDAAMRTLNRSFRRKDRTTDVLSFPSGSAPGGFLGDLIVSEPEARRQARRSRSPYRRTVEKLLLHGLLHLLGYDHETDDGEMDAIEGRLRRRLSTAP